MVVRERHRHRYEVAPEHVRTLEAGGLVFSGVDARTGRRMAVLELPRSVHPFFVACQFHPEYNSTVASPHPLFAGLIEAVVSRRCL